MNDINDIFAEEEAKAYAEAKRTEADWNDGAQRRRVRSILELRRMRRNGCIEAASDDEEE